MVTLSAFTKPWQIQSIEDLAQMLSKIGLSGVEYCLREGYQIEPQNAYLGLKKIKECMQQYGIELTSIAGPLDETTIEACAICQVPFIRTLVPLNLQDRYEKAQEAGRKYIESFLSIAEKYKVSVGLQLHTKSLMNNSFELYRFLKEFDSPYLHAIWDSAHSTLAGEDPKHSLTILHPYLCSINLKNVSYVHINEEQEIALWKSKIVCGRKGISSWPTIINLLKSLEYNGNFTLAHEYDDQQNLNGQLADDKAYFTSLWEGPTT